VTLEIKKKEENSFFIETYIFTRINIGRDEIDDRKEKTGDWTKTYLEETIIRNIMYLCSVYVT